jgi:hypothetical protein
VTRLDALGAIARFSAGQTRELWLSELGLYRDIGQKTLAPGLREYEPAYPLFSDGASKRRWLCLPPGMRIDSRDMDHWRVPPGTLLFKEFAQDGKRIETRVLARTGGGARDFFMGAFVWNHDESDARFEPDGVRQARDAEHDVPSVKNCFTCHQGEPGHVLGLSAIQQPNLAAELLSEPVPPGVRAPGDELAAAALGYLHGNCAHCHNPHGSARPDSDMDLRLYVADHTLQNSPAYRTTVGQRLQSFRDGRLALRIAPGDPEASALLERMADRGSERQMPPLGTRRIDVTGLASVRAFIEALREGHPKWQTGGGNARRVGEEGASRGGAGAELAVGVDRECVDSR